MSPLLGNAQTTTVGLRGGANLWSNPRLSSAPVYNSTQFSTQPEIFLRRHGRNQWVQEWSIGTTRYQQDIGFDFFDGPERGRFDIRMIDPSFSLLRDVSCSYAGNASATEPRVSTYVGLTLSAVLMQIESQIIGDGGWGGPMVSTRRFKASTLYAGPVVANSVRLGKVVSLESLLTYRLTRAVANFSDPQLPAHRLSATLGIAANL